MKRIKYILVFVAVVLFATQISAQHTMSGYFMDGYMYRHEINPAIGNKQNYISFPAIGNLNLGIRGSLNLDDFLYTVDGKTATFLNPAISTSEFESKIKNKNKLNFDAKIQIMSAGFNGFGGYNTIGVNFRSSIYTMLPKSLLLFAKNGVSANGKYDISDFRMHVNSYAEIAFGHSRDINEKLRVGASLKFLLGIANIDAEFNKVQLYHDGFIWDAVTNAEIKTSVKNFAYKTDISESTNKPYVNGVAFDGFGVAGYGLAVDFGAEYKLDENWKFGAALLDLGFISWNNNVLATTNGDNKFSTPDYKFTFDNNDIGDFNNELDKLSDGLVSLYELDDAGDQGKRTKSLAATLNLAAEYTMPFYDRLTLGLLNTTRFQGEYTWTDFRLSANVAPLKYLSANVNVAAGTYGCAFGWMLNFHPNGFNLFVGMDQFLCKVTEEFIPLSGNASFNLGVNIPF